MVQTVIEAEFYEPSPSEYILNYIKNIFFESLSHVWPSLTPFRMTVIAIRN